MKWVNKIQKIGRIQIPTKYLTAYNIKEGDYVLIEESNNNKLIFTFKVNKEGKPKK